MDSPSLKILLGCWLHERWETEVALRLPRVFSRGRDWKWLCNRHERLSSGADGAVVCDWEDSSFLTVARCFPRVGGRLLRRCLEEWPVRLTRALPVGRTGADPKISVILPVGGLDRSSQFLGVLAAFSGQTVPEIEILAVEHAATPEFRRLCPSSVTYLFIPRSGGRQFNKSLAMNAAVSVAKAPHVLLHDADLVPPAGYIQTILEKLAQGWDAVRPIRFAFHLDRRATETFLNRNGETVPEQVAEIQANNPGLSTAVRKEIYEKIGGHDERFEGWGGEDREFLDRLNQARVFPGGFLPAIHLWHPPAAQKASGHRNNSLGEELRGIPPSERIGHLRELYSPGRATV